MAHKKGQGSSRNGRDSNAQRLGVKRHDGLGVRFFEDISDSPWGDPGPTRRTQWAASASQSRSPARAPGPKERPDDEACIGTNPPEL